MGLIGDVSRVDCDITPESQALPVKLYEMVCGYDGRDTEMDENAGGILAGQRIEESWIINEKLMHGQDWFDESSLVVLDCPRAFGGICVIDDVPDSSYIYVTSFRLIGEISRDGITIQRNFFLETQEPRISIEGETNQDVLGAMILIRQSRAFFDHPELAERLAASIQEGIRFIADAVLILMGIK